MKNGRKIAGRSRLEGKARGQRVTYCAPEYNVPSLLTDWSGWPSWFSDKPENTNLVEGVKILLLVKFHFKFRSALSEKNWKMNLQIRGRDNHLGFPLRLKNTRLLEDIEILQPVKFRWIPYNVFRDEVEISESIRGRTAIFVFWSPKNYERGRGRWNCVSCQTSFNYVQRFQRRSRKCLSQ